MTWVDSDIPWSWFPQKDLQRIKKKTKFCLTYFFFSTCVPCVCQTVSKAEASLFLFELQHPPPPQKKKKKLLFQRNTCSIFMLSRSSSLLPYKFCDIFLLRLQWSDLVMLMIVFLRIVMMRIVFLRIVMMRIVFLRIVMMMIKMKTLWELVQKSVNAYTRFLRKLAPGLQNKIEENDVNLPVIIYFFHL